VSGQEKNGMAFGKDRVTTPEIALIAAAAERGGALLLPATMADPVIASLEMGGHLVRTDEVTEAGEAGLYRIQLTRSGWELARNRRIEAPVEPRRANAGYHRPDVAPHAISRSGGT
jgi:hypothetical protein